ncbi:MAG: hypothetical protein ACJ714_01375, partial [Ornithinibacter sp.]
VGDQALGMSTGRPESGSAFEYGRAGTALVQQSLRAATGVLRRWRLDQKRILKLASQFPDLVDDVAEARLLLRPAGASDGVALRSASDDAASSEAAARAVLAGAGTTDDIVRVDRALLRTRGREGVDDARFEDYWRRTAQVALAEGEILSLTDPATGSELLQLARERFTAVRDAPGELFALVLWHLAVAREGKALTSDAANELMAAYEAAAPSRVDKDLRLVREPAGRSAGIAELAGWETRLRAALSAAGHADGEVPKGDVPSEMKLPAPSPSPFSFLPMPVTSRLSPRRLLQWVVEWTVAGLLIFAPVVAWWAVRKLTPLPDAGFWACYFQVWGVIAVVLGIGGLGRRRRTGKSQPWTALRVRARPLTAPGREDELAGARVTVEVEPFCAPSRYSRIRAIAPLERTAGRVLADLAGPNRFDVELSLAPGLSPPLLDLGSRAVLARHRVVILDLDDDLVSLDWEKWRVGPVDSARLHHFRNYPPLDAAAPWTQVVDVVAERAWQGLGQDVWMPSSRELRLWSGDIPAGGSISCVIHAIGTPVPSSSGWRLRINNLRPAIKAAEPVDREVLVGPEGLHVVGKVVILQSKPDRDESSVDRDGLRAIAHDFMLGGALAVIVLPSLPRRLVSSALSQTANQLFARGQTPRLRELLAFTQDIRRTADVGKDHGADSAWDITGNVSLFARFEED